MQKLVCSLLIFIISFSVVAAQSGREKIGVFSGRVVRLVPETSLLRVKVDFNNLKYLNKENRVSVFTNDDQEVECLGTVMGKSNDYLLLKLSNYSKCKSHTFLGLGGWVNFYSDDLVRNIKTGSDLYQLLLKKHVAVNSKVVDSTNGLNRYVDRMEALNQRYIILREKLEQEWRREIGLIENDRTIAVAQHKTLEIELDDILKKLEQYKIEDDNLRTDRWSLDPQLFYRK